VQTTSDIPEEQAQIASVTMSDYGFPTFRCSHPVTSDDVQALLDEEPGNPDYN
jgi:hypothetical protein